MRARAYDAAGALPEALRTIVPGALGPERLAALVASGQPVRITVVQPSAPAVVEFTPGVSLLVHRLHGEVCIACQRHYLRGQTQREVEFRLYGLAGGERRELGRYLVDHHVVG